MTITREGAVIQMRHQQGVEPTVELAPEQKLEHGQRPEQGQHGPGPGPGQHQLGQHGPGLGQHGLGLGLGLEHGPGPGQQGPGLGLEHGPELGLERGQEQDPLDSQSLTLSQAGSQ